MTTRLDRLVLLLETGSNTSVRHQAALNLAQVVKQSNQDVFLVLPRVANHLRSKNWDTRVAASDAILQVALALKPWVPVESTDSSLVDENNFLNFDTFDINLVVKNGTLLVASSGAEFEADLFDESLSSKDRLALQKKHIKKRLGLGMDMMVLLFN